MPVQRTLFGMPIGIPMLPRRMIVLFGSIIFFTTCLFLFGGSSSGSDGSYRFPGPSDFRETMSKNLGGWSKSAAHEPPPPTQLNSSSGDTSWYSNWKWRNPFSWAVTFDENRALLPPLPQRPAIYTYYDVTKAKNQDMVQAENELLLIWRRAWWAQGFKPQVLGPPEAMNNQKYEALSRIALEGDAQDELMRWLAWDQMGGGILSNYLAFPMAAYDDDMLSFLRRGEYPGLVRFKGLDNALFCGEGSAVSQALMDVFKNAAPPESGKKKKKKKGGKHKTPSPPESMIEAIGEFFTVDERGNSIAWYNTEVISKNYPNVEEELETKRPANGLYLLAQLINSHLHITWQNSFSKGIEVLKPFEQYMTIVVEPAIDLARNLTQCSATPEAKSCPPNNKRCKPCSESKPLPITLPEAFSNKSSVYTIGSCVHPYTLIALTKDKEEIDAKFIRRHTKRDTWLAAIMNKILKAKLPASARAVAFKDAVASDYGSTTSLWMTAERETHKDLNWIFGFAIPYSLTANASVPLKKSQRPKTPQGLALYLPGDRPPAPKLPSGAAEPHPVHLRHQTTLLQRARDLIHSKVHSAIRLREAAEGWNLADTEAWKFARAYSARRRVERLVWEEEERRFAGAENRRDGWGGWMKEKMGLSHLLGSG